MAMTFRVTRMRNARRTDCDCSPVANSGRYRNGRTIALQNATHVTGSMTASRIERTPTRSDRPPKSVIDELDITVIHTTDTRI